MKSKKIKKILFNEYQAEKADGEMSQSFDSLVEYGDFTIKGNYQLFRVGDVTFNILVINYTHVLTSGRALKMLDNSNYLFGLVEGAKDLGSAYIRPETIRDKINELIKPVEIDFDDTPKFSRMFYVLSENEKGIRSSLSKQFRELLTEYKSCEVEMKEGSLLLRLNRVSANESNIHELVRFLNKLATHI